MHYLLWFWEDLTGQWQAWDLRAVCNSYGQAKSIVETDPLNHDETEAVWVANGKVECARTGIGGWTIEPIGIGQRIESDPAFPGEKVFDPK